MNVICIVKNICYLLILLSFSMFGQQKQFTLTWNSESSFTSSSGSVYKVPSFQKENFVLGVDQVYFQASWQVNASVEPSSLVVSELVYTSLSTAEIAQVKKLDIPNAIAAKISASTNRGQHMATLQLYPIIKQNGAYKKVRSFAISYKTLKNRHNKSHLGKVSSVLRTGKWYRFTVSSSGVYKIDASFLQSLGVSLEDIDPDHIKIYGYGGDMLPLANAQTSFIDPPEIPIQVITKQDKIFSNNDYVLFYAQGPDLWNKQSQTHNNLFTDTIDYFITFEQGQGKRISPAILPPGASTTEITTYNAYQYQEKDQASIALVGRRWFDTRFLTNTTQQLTFDFPDRVLNTPVEIGVKAAAVSSTATQLYTTVSGVTATTLYFPALGPQATYSATQDPNKPDGTLLTKGLRIAKITTPGTTIPITMRYASNANPSAECYLDYIYAKAEVALKANGKQFVFTSDKATNGLGIGTYQISQAKDVIAVWDVTDIHKVTKYENTAFDAVFRFKTVLGAGPKKYCALVANDFKIPSYSKKGNIVENQNLKQTVFTDALGNTTDVDYIIIAPSFLKTQAQRLADFHNQKNALRTKVVTLQEIYNEFNTGNQDVAAIRNFIKYVYDNATHPDKRLQYVCLFGDASIDYKNRVPKNTNIVPVYHSYESFSNTHGVASDDFYGMLDPEEGETLATGFLDIAVGRILADTPSTANAMVDKVITYATQAAYGRWRTNFTLLSDDIDKNAVWEATIQSNLDALGDKLNQEKPFINVTKIHADAYKQEASAAGDRYPKVNQALLNAIDAGTLVVNYFGHGGEDGLANERYFTKKMAQELNNKQKLPLFITSTCEFARFDNPYRKSAGEYVVLNPTAGAIGLISTTREIYVNNGITFNNVLSKHLFSYGSNTYYSIAESLRRAKNDPSFGSGVQKRILFYFGDPALYLAIPGPSMAITHINDIPVTAHKEPLQALSKATIKGEVLTASGIVDTDYSGVVYPTIYDKMITKTTLGNDNTRDASGTLIQMDFKALGAVLYKGKAKVTNGKFSFDCVIPKDIDVSVGKGRIGLYSHDKAIQLDKAGYDTSVLIGGIDTSVAADNQGPDIEVFLNNDRFISGGTTNSSPLLLVHALDKNGINTAQGIGHDMVAVLDGDTANPIVLNAFYESELDTYTQGKIAYPLRDLAPGAHTLQVKIWDTHNNSSTAEISFVVLNKDKIKLERVLNYPNPFVSHTEFWFHHNKPFEPLQVQVQVFTISGKLVWNTQKTITTDGFFRDIIWDGTDNFKQKIAKGVYLYKIKVKSTLSNQTTEVIEKLVKL